MKGAACLCRSLLCAAFFFTLLAIGDAVRAENEPAGSWNAVEFGAVPDGVTDCTDAIQKALDTAGNAGGGTVTLPAGRFSVRGTLSIPRGVTLEGTYRAAITIQSKDQQVDGTVLLAYAGRGSNEGPAFITLAGTNAVLKGIAVIYPEWSRKDVPPVPYPPCVESHDTENVGVLDCCLLNPYEGIKFVRAARHLVRNITGYPIWRGLFVDQCYDIGHIENIHYWPFGLIYNPKDPYCEWININGVAFELARTDWHYMANLFCFGYGVGYKFSDCGYGGTNGNFLGLGADSCRRAVLVESAQLPGLLITNGEFVGRWTSSDSVCIEITEAVDGKVSLCNCSFWGPINTCVVMNAPRGQFTANACNFCNWDVPAEGFPAIQLNAGKSIISASTFQQGGKAVAVGAGVENVILNANQGQGGFFWSSDASESRVTAAGNEEPFQPIEEEALSSYKLHFGDRYDSLYIHDFYSAERVGDTPFRWARPQSQIELPVPKGKRVFLDFEADVPPGAVADSSEKPGIYFGDTLGAPITKAGRQILRVQIPPQTADSVLLTIRSNSWTPGTADQRNLGVQFFSVRLTADGVPESRYYDVDAQKWIGE